MELGWSRTWLCKSVGNNVLLWVGSLSNSWMHKSQFRIKSILEGMITVDPIVYTYVFLLSILKTLMVNFSVVYVIVYCMSPVHVCFVAVQHVKFASCIFLNFFLSFILYECLGVDHEKL